MYQRVGHVADSVRNPRRPIPNVSPKNFFHVAIANATNATTSDTLQTIRIHTRARNTKRGRNPASCPYISATRSEQFHHGTSPCCKFFKGMFWTNSTKWASQDSLSLYVSTTVTLSADNAWVRSSPSLTPKHPLSPLTVTPASISFSLSQTTSQPPIWKHKTTRGRSFKRGRACPQQL